ncbi:MAG: class I SAM-dependent methyltransferase [Solirubrobacterales bacterium]
MAEQESVDLDAVKQGQQQMWSQGDFAVIATTMQIIGENLCETVGVLPGERVLDVACGSGNTAIAAARRFADVTGVDYVPALLDRARERAAAERLEIEFVEGDAEALPVDEGTFDCVLSTFGAMFAPDQERAAGELLRVCGPGGRIGMANWTPGGFVGQMFKTTMSHVAPDGPPPGVKPPPLWGTEERLRELFGDEVTDLVVERRECVFRFHSPEHWLELFRTYFGPTKVAFETVGEKGDALGAELLELAGGANTGGERAMIVPGEYVEVVATRA